MKKPRNIHTMVQPEVRICKGCNAPRPVGRFREDLCIFCQVKKTIEGKMEKGFFNRIVKSILKSETKRYSLSESGMVEDEQGEWVLYQDINKRD